MHIRPSFFMFPEIKHVIYKFQRLFMLHKATWKATFLLLCDRLVLTEPHSTPHHTHTAMSAAKVRMEEDPVEIDTGKVTIVPGTMTEPQCATFCLQDEDHTLGNALRWTLMKNPEVDFASYSIPHPSETRTNVRIQTSDNTTAVDAIFKGLDDLTDICSHVIQTFQAELAKGEFEYYDESAF
ncbi:unnamed protein product [Mortierella alpina]